MAIFNWTSLTEETFAFNPNTDVLHFDDPEITAGLGPDAAHQFDYFADPGDPNPTCFFGFGGVEHGLLNVDPRKLHSGNITFENGVIDSLFIYGDNTLATNTDDSGNTINGGAGNDWLIGAGGNDIVNGGDGHDMLVVIGSGKLGTGEWGNDTLNGGAGVDHVFYDGATLGIDVNLATGESTGGRAGANTLELVSIEQVATGVGNDTIVGSGAANFLFANDGNDRLTGAGGADRLDGGSGADTMWGGGGHDMYFVNATSDVVIEKSGEGDDTIFSSVTRELDSHEENLGLTGTANRTGTGNSLDNVIDGNSGANKLYGESGDDVINGQAGNDTIFGGSGDDVLDGGLGSDSMIGGSGSDTYDVGFGEGDVVVEEENASGVDTVITNGSITMPDWIEKLVWINTLGGGGTCTGNSLDNVMSVSNDGVGLTMNGGNGSDTISYEGQEDAVAVDLDGGTATFVDSLQSMENATGGLGDDSLTGDEIANVLDGSDGSDTMIGAYGDDVYHVDSLEDIVVEANNDLAPALLLGGVAGITDTVIAAIDYSLEALEFLENLTLSAEALTGTGNALDNVITGNAQANALNGLDGADLLDGAGGVDTLNGGIGDDSLVWRSGDIYDGGAGVDTLTMGKGNLNLKNVVNTAFTDMEQVDLSGDGANKLTLLKADVLAMNAEDTLTVIGSGVDSVSAVGFVQDLEYNVVGYNRYTKDTATLLVDSDVQVILV